MTGQHLARGWHMGHETCSAGLTSHQGRGGSHDPAIGPTAAEPPGGTSGQLLSWAPGALSPDLGAWMWVITATKCYIHSLSTSAVLGAQMVTEAKVPRREQWDSQPTRKWQSQGQSAHPEVRSYPAQGTTGRGLCGGDLSPNPYSNRSPALWSSSVGAGWARHMQPTPHHFLIPSETCTAWHLTAQDPGCPVLPQGHLSFSQRTWEKERKNQSQWVNSAQQMKTRYFQKWKLESKKGLLDITNTVFTMV